MPGSKRRALKKLLSPTSSPAASAPQPTSPQPIPSSFQSLPPPATTAPLSASSSPSKSRENSGFNLFGSNKKGSSTSLHPSNSMQSVTSAQSGKSIASEPANYLTDGQLKEDLVIEQMVERERSIGSNAHRTQDGVPDLEGSQSIGAVGGGGSVPPPMPPSMPAVPGQPKAGGGYVSGTQGGGAGQQPGNSTGGMFAASALASSGQAPQQMTAEQLMYGDDTGKKKKSSRQRFEERQQRRKEALIHSAPPSDPNWTAQLEKERQDEIRTITDACDVLGREIYEIAPDGHCMFNAISDQLYLLGVIPAEETSSPLYARRSASQYMLKHQDDFIAFLPGVNGEDMAGATAHDGILTEKEFHKYCRNIEETGDWGGEPEIQALSRAFQVPIHVIQCGPPVIVSHGGTDDDPGGGMTAQQSVAQGDRVVRISYHKRMYGLGEHYNSLRKMDQM